MFTWVSITVSICCPHSKHYCYSTKYSTIERVICFQIVISISEFRIVLFLFKLIIYNITIPSISKLFFKWHLSSVWYWSFIYWTSQSVTCDIQKHLWCRTAPSVNDKTFHIHTVTKSMGSNCCVTHRYPGTTLYPYSICLRFYLQDI
jgi:hypothetical protein